MLRFHTRLYRKVSHDACCTAFTRLLTVDKPMIRRFSEAPQTASIPSTSKQMQESSNLLKSGDRLTGSAFMRQLFNVSCVRIPSHTSTSVVGVLVTLYCKYMTHRHRLRTMTFHLLSRPCLLGAFADDLLRQAAPLRPRTVGTDAGRCPSGHSPDHSVTDVDSAAGNG